MRAVGMVLLLVAAALAGCAGTDDGRVDPEGFVVPEQDDEGRYVVRMTSDDRYVPEKAEVPVGSTVVWVAEGGSHDVEAEDGSFRSPPQVFPEWELEVTEDLLGDNPYHCNPHRHRGMVGVLRVVE